MSTTINYANAVVAAGTADAMTATIVPAALLTMDLLPLYVRVPGPNTTTTPTLNLNTGGALTIVKGNGSPLAANDMLKVAILSKDIANNRWVLLNPQSSSGGTQDLEDVLTADPSTGNIPIESPDGQTKVHVINDEFIAENDGALITISDSALAGTKYYQLKPGTGEHKFVGPVPMTFNGVNIATEDYVASAVAGLLDYRGTFDASGGAYPSSGGSGTAGAVLKSDFWIISVAGTLPTGQVAEAGDMVIAKIDTPGNTQANWNIIQYNIGYTPENTANKTNTVAGNEASTSLYLSVKGYYDYLIGAFKTYLDTLYVSSTTPKLISVRPLGAFTPSSLADTTAVYFGSPQVNTPNANPTLRQIKLMTGVVRTGQIYATVGTTLASAQDVTVNLRNITDGVSSLLGVFQLTGIVNVLQFSGVEIAVDSSKDYALELVPPVLTTNPTNVQYSGSLNIFDQ